MQLFDLYHHHYAIRKLIPSDFWLFELSVWLHVLARSLITVFIPILLLQTGFSLQTVILFYLVYHAVDIPLNFAVGRMITVIGARKVMFLANIFIIFFFVSLNVIGAAQYWMLGVMAILLALYDSAYWVAHLFLFMQSDTDPAKTSKETGALYSIKKVATMLGPLVGAGLLIFVDQTVLVILASFLFVSSAVPLIYVTDFPDRPKTRAYRYRISQFLTRGIDLNNYLSTGLFSVHKMAELVIWPLFIYTILGTIESVAFIPAIIAVTTIIISLITSRIMPDTREIMIIVGALLVAGMWVARMFIDGSIFYFVSIALVSTFSLLITIPLDSNLFVRARRTDPLLASVLRNTFSMGSRFVFLILPLAVLVNIFNVTFTLAATAMIVLAAVNCFFLIYDRNAYRALSG